LTFQIEVSDRDFRSQEISRIDEVKIRGLNLGFELGLKLYLNYTANYTAKLSRNPKHW